MIDRQRLDQELERMKGLIRDDRAVRDLFDLDGNGEIEGGEWEQVRRLVVRRLEREVGEARRARDLAQTTGVEYEDALRSEPGRVASQIFNRDLPALLGPSTRVGSLAAASDLILEPRSDDATGAEPLSGHALRR